MPTGSALVVYVAHWADEHRARAGQPEIGFPFTPKAIVQESVSGRDLITCGPSSHEVERLTQGGEHRTVSSSSATALSIKMAAAIDRISDSKGYRAGFARSGRIPVAAVSEAEDDAVFKTDVVLPVVGEVGQIRGDEVGLDKTQCDGVRDADVGAASHLERTAVGAAGSAGGARKKTVRSEYATAQELAEEIDGMRVSCGEVKRIARASHHRELRQVHARLDVRLHFAVNHYA